MILAGSDQELIDRYLDKEKNAPDYAQLKELEEKQGRDYEKEIVSKGIEKFCLACVPGTAGFV